MSEPTRVTGRLIYKHGLVPSERNPDPVQHATVEVEPLTEEQKINLKTNDEVLIRCFIYRGEDGSVSIPLPVGYNSIPIEKIVAIVSSVNICSICPLFKESRGMCALNERGECWKAQQPKYDPNLKVPERICGYTMDEILRIIDYAKQHGYEIRKQPPGFCECKGSTQHTGGWVMGEKTGLHDKFITVCTACDREMYEGQVWPPHEFKDDPVMKFCREQVDRMHGRRQELPKRYKCPHCKDVWMMYDKAQAVELKDQPGEVENG